MLLPHCASASSFESVGEGKGEGEGETTREEEPTRSTYGHVVFLLSSLYLICTLRGKSTAIQVHGFVSASFLLFQAHHHRLFAGTVPIAAAPFRATVKLHAPWHSQYTGVPLSVGECWTCCALAASGTCAASVLLGNHSAGRTIWLIDVLFRMLRRRMSTGPNVPW